MDFLRAFVPILASSLFSSVSRVHSVANVSVVNVSCTARPNFTVIVPDGYRPAVAVDCTSRTVTYKSNISIRYPNKVTVVDETGKVLLDVLIKSPVKIRNMDHGPNALNYLHAKELVKNVTRFKILVGKDLESFLKLFEMRHIKYLLRDASFMFNGYASVFQQYRYSQVARKFLNREVTDSGTKENALTLIEIYKNYRKNWKEYIAVSVRSPMSVDCEMVECTKDNQHRFSVVARVSIVDHRRRVVYDRVFKPDLPVTNCRTWITGLRYRDIRHGGSLRREKRHLVALLKDRILVGHDIGQDLRGLGINIPQPLIRDSCQYLRFRRMYPNKMMPSLQELAKDLLNMSIQETYHSSVEDARANMNLYLLFRKDWDKEAIRHI